jgi:hypothetical protein
MSMITYRPQGKKIDHQTTIDSTASGNCGAVMEATSLTLGVAMLNPRAQIDGRKMQHWQAWGNVGDVIRQYFPGVDLSECKVNTAAEGAWYPDLRSRYKIPRSRALHEVQRKWCQSCHVSEHPTG